MEKVRVQVAKTPEGYCATVDILPGFIVAVTGDFGELKKELFESVDFYVECAKADGDVYPEVLNQEYEFEYKFDVESLLFFYEKILSKAALERLTGINQSNLVITLVDVLNHVRLRLKNSECPAYIGAGFISYLCLSYPTECTPKVLCLTFGVHFTFWTALWL
ncbi:MAG: hypothetical protein ACLU4N_28270 [Butyricimonas faecihominis]